MAIAASLVFVDIAHSESLAYLRDGLAARMVHYGLEDLDAGDLRRRTPRALTQEISRYIFEHGVASSGDPIAGIRYRSRLGDELENWAIFEGHDLDEIVEFDAIITDDDPDLVAALHTRPDACHNLILKDAVASAGVVYRAVATAMRTILRTLWRTPTIGRYSSGMSWRRMATLRSDRLVMLLIRVSSSRMR